MKEDEKYKQINTRYYGSKESGSWQRLPVFTLYVDITTGELITYQQVYLQGKYIAQNIKTKIYDDIINQRIERTRECTPTNTDRENNRKETD